ncbi:malonate--CoA ligase ACSF3, mitochondrial-like [Periplaneta americana]|uniref:malonate--CoA ligase ACSF3, mitochondrial-like n=1 Tax=Periplaneta americana TaxID=6978 RepID=UPI0037E71B47
MTMTTLLSSRFISLRFVHRTPCVFTSHCWQASLSTQTSSAHEASRNTAAETVTPVFQHALKFSDRVALKDRHGTYTYQGLFNSSNEFARQISESISGRVQERIAFLCHNDASYAITQWACWMSGQIAVPLTSQHPPALQEYYIRNCEASVLVTTADFVDVVEPLATKTNAKLLVLDEALRRQAMAPTPGTQISLFESGLSPEFYRDSDALIIYTSGTTGAPKGVVISHKNIQAQVSSLTEAWGWSQDDAILHVLPLHHIHGIVNVLLCSQASGARCVMLPKFDASVVWNHLLGKNVSNNEEINVFMAVPTIYVKLLEEYERMVAKDPSLQEHVYNTCSQKIRLMVSGSAPLPAPLFKRWEDVTGHKLLERFGMSETGMVLSNPLNGERKPGFVGTPLPGMEVQITRPGSESKYEILVHSSAAAGTTVLSKETTTGDLLVRGPNVFNGYWKMPEATKKEFTDECWFKTGDTAQYAEGAFKILGRSSVDIIKTGGYKVSALEIETHLLGHPDIIDCAVVGLPDNTWGQKVAVVIVTRGGKNIILLQLREWCKKRMALYAIPTMAKIVESIPKNALGKTNKKELIKKMFPETVKSQLD